MANGKIDENGLKNLLQKGKNIVWSKRIDFRSLELEIVEESVLHDLTPLVVANTTLAWKRDRDMFSPDWLKKNCGDLNVRLIDTNQLKDASGKVMREYIDSLNNGSSSITSHNIPTPSSWRDYLSQKLPEWFCRGKQDLQNNLFKELQPNESCWSNVGGNESISTTASTHPLGCIGQSLMVYTDNENSYALWFVISGKDVDRAVEYFNDKLEGISLASNIYGPEPTQVVIPLEMFVNAPFTVYVIEQREGDWVLLPSDSMYEVFNRGQRNVRISWDIVLPQTIEHSYRISLPRSRLYARPEHFRLKATAYYALLNRIELAESNKPDVDALSVEIPPLLTILEDIIQKEWIQPSATVPSATKKQQQQLDSETEIDKLRFIDDKVPHQRICQFCKCDIFNRCYHCSECSTTSSPFSGYDVCIDCVAEGRSCPHKSQLKLFEYESLQHIKQTFEKAKSAYEKLVRNAKRKRGAKTKKPIEEWIPAKFPDNICSPATIAYRVVHTYQIENEKVCHQCQKAQPISAAITLSCNNREGKITCAKYWCTKCLWNRYGIKLLESWKAKQWICPYCHDDCNCNPCLEKKNILESSLNADEIVQYPKYFPFPFATIEAPNIPSPSDLKPVFQTYNLKKRKFLADFKDVTSPAKPVIMPPNVQTQLSQMLQQPQLTQLLQQQQHQQHQQPGFSSHQHPQQQFQQHAGILPNTSTNFSSSLNGGIPNPNFLHPQAQYPNQPQFPNQLQPHQHQQQQQQHLLQNPASIGSVSKVPSYGTLPSSPRKDDLNSISRKEDLTSTPRNSNMSPQVFSSPTPSNRSFEQLNSPSISKSNPNLSTNSSSSTSQEDLPSTLLVKGIPISCTINNIKDFFGNNEVEKVIIPWEKPYNGRNKGFCFVKFFTRSLADSSFAKFQGQSWADKKLEIEWAPDKGKEPLQQGPTCFKCGQFGHVSKNCPNPAASNPQQQQPQQPPPQQQQQSSSSSNALSNSNPQQSSNSRKVSCFNCGQEGHIVSQCTQESKQACFKCGKEGHLPQKCTEPRGPNAKAVTCFKCGQEGHFANKCPNILSKSQQQSSPPQSSSSSSSNTTNSSSNMQPQQQSNGNSIVGKSSIQSSNSQSSNSQSSQNFSSNSSQFSALLSPSLKAALSNVSQQPPNTSSTIQQPHQQQPQLQQQNNNNYSQSNNNQQRSSFNNGNNNGQYQYQQQLQQQQPQLQHQPPLQTLNQSNQSSQPQQFSSPSGKSTSQSNGAGRLFCYKCGKEGHLAQQCEEKPLFSNQQQPQQSNQPQQQRQSNSSFNFNNGVNNLNGGGSSSGSYSSLTGNGLNSNSSLNGTNSSINQVQSPEGQSSGGGDREKLKLEVSKIVVTRLSRYLNAGEIRSKEDFKKLSRRVTHDFVEQEAHNRFQKTPDLDNRIKSMIESYVERLRVGQLSLENY